MLVTTATTTTTKTTATTATTTTILLIITMKKSINEVRFLEFASFLSMQKRALLENITRSRLRALSEQTKYCKLDIGTRKG